MNLFIPRENWNHIFEFLKRSKDIANLAKTCKSLYLISKPICSKKKTLRILWKWRAKIQTKIYNRVYNEAKDKYIIAGFYDFGITPKFLDRIMMKDYYCFLSFLNIRSYKNYNHFPINISWIIIKLLDNIGLRHIYKKDVCVFRDSYLDYQEKVWNDAMKKLWYCPLISFKNK